MNVFSTLEATKHRLVEAILMAWAKYFTPCISVYHSNCSTVFSITLLGLVWNCIIFDNKYPISDCTTADVKYSLLDLAKIGLSTCSVCCVERQPGRFECDLGVIHITILSLQAMAEVRISQWKQMYDGSHWSESGLERPAHIVLSIRPYTVATKLAKINHV